MFVGFARLNAQLGTAGSVDFGMVVRRALHFFLYYSCGSLPTAFNHATVLVLYLALNFLLTANHVNARGGPETVFVCLFLVGWLVGW